MIAAATCAGVACSDGCSVLANRAPARPSVVMTVLPGNYGRSVGAASPAAHPGRLAGPAGPCPAIPAAQEHAAEHQQHQHVRAEHDGGKPVQTAAVLLP